MGQRSLLNGRFKLILQMSTLIINSKVFENNIYVLSKIVFVFCITRRRILRGYAGHTGFGEKNLNDGKEKVGKYLF